ncbi:MULTISPECIES: dienelactone hydrolase [unclassified Brevundimonas]|uniref:alpha/beta hydrolase family protein n=1 Tax=unclassified Brevundimonas TaxID=2622653 RepID=UPI0025C1B389|nr:MULTISPECIES: dienelactone hydrolase [unclassified Brevundimonas]
MPRKNTFRPVLNFLAVALLLVGAQPAQARAPETVRFAGPSGEMIEAAVWSPAAPERGPSPLVVISHGNSGSALGHQDTAEALADAGFVVAALTHPGDNFRDMSRSLALTDRPPQVSALISYMTGDWPGTAKVDESRIGAFGFSAGGFTVAALAGGEADAQKIVDHCSAHPEFFVCTIIAAQGGLDLKGWQASARDPRITAAVMAAPGFGFAFSDESVRAIAIPVQLWQAGEDQILPSPWHVEPFRDRLPGDPDYQLVAGALHHDFLVPCAAEMRMMVPELCQSRPGFDRAAFKQTFNREVAAFFVRELRPSSDTRGRLGQAQQQTY